jgi:hypothetical protein
MNAQPLLSAWQTYYFALATAAATLAGLLFVGLTFSVGAIRGDVAKLVRIWAEPTLFDFVQVLVISCLALFPGLTPGALGVFLMAWTLWRVWRLVEVALHFKGLGSQGDLELADWMELVILPGLLYLALVAAAAGFFLGEPWSPLALALDCLGVLVLGIYNTWSQLVWMAAQKTQAPKKKPGN